MKLALYDHVDRYRFGITVIPRYKIIEINLGRYSLDIHWRKSEILYGQFYYWRK